MKKVVMNDEEIERSLTRIAYEILERNRGAESLIIVGIRTGGSFWPVVSGTASRP